MVANTAPGLSLPTQRQALDESGVVFCAPVWYRFLQGLLNRTQATIPATTAGNLSSAGTTLGTAAELTDEWSVITTTPLNGGVMLVNFGEGFDNRVFNRGINPVKVYPPPGCTIDSLAVEAPYVLAAGKMQIFTQISQTAFLTAQLG